jgi:hypothetical protein
MSSGRILAIAAALATAACHPVGPLPPAPAALVSALDARVADPCNASTAAALASRSVTADQVTAITYEVLDAGPRFGYERIGTRAWVELAGQPGAALIDMGVSCDVNSITAVRGLRFPR